MTFDDNPEAPTISGMADTIFSDGTDGLPVALTYTVTNIASQTDALFFTVQVVNVTVAGDGTVDYLDGALAANNVGGDNNNDMRLLLPPVNGVDDVMVTAYTPSSPPAGVTFSGVAMDIALDFVANATRSLPTGTTATVCLSTEGVPERRIPAIYRLPTATATVTNPDWVALTPATTPTIQDFVKRRHYPHLLAVRGRLCSACRDF